MKVPGFVHGNIAPTFTAFHEQGSLDDDGQRNLLDFMLQSGTISTYFIRSGMGQMYAFQYEDAKQLTKTVCEHMAGKAPVIVGCNGIWERNYDERPDPDTFVKECITLANHAEDCGAQGVVYTVPEAWVPEGGESMHDMFVRYFETICSAVSLPVFIYQPPNTHKDYLLTPSILSRLADIDTLVGLKASYSDGYYVYSLIRSVKDKDFAYICGNETIYYAALYAGSRAIIGQGSTVNPQILQVMQNRFMRGDHAGVLEAQDAVTCLAESCPNPVDFYKRYATEHGFPVKPYFRTYRTNPYGKDPTPMTDDQYAGYKRLLESELARFAAAEKA